MLITSPRDLRPFNTTPGYFIVSRDPILQSIHLISASEIRLQRMLYFHSGRNIDKTAPAEYSTVQGTELVITGRDDLAEPFSEKIRSLLQSVRATHEDHTLGRNCLFDVRVDRLAIKLSFDPGEELPFALGNAEPLE